ncbi:hypothetical protein ANAPC5_01435 [Anaplasma phagocytophilum]|nr:hypothetical protein ANAPC5_01435 [Anaplasma phagocytophilum]
MCGLPLPDCPSASTVRDATASEANNHRLWPTAATSRRNPSQATDFRCSHASASLIVPDCAKVRYRSHSSCCVSSVLPLSYQVSLVRFRLIETVTVLPFYFCHHLTSLLLNVSTALFVTCPVFVPPSLEPTYCGIAGVRTPVAVCGECDSPLAPHRTVTFSGVRDRTPVFRGTAGRRRV